MSNVINFNDYREKRGLTVLESPDIPTPATETGRIVVQGVTEDQVNALGEAIVMAFTLGVWASGGTYPEHEYPSSTHIVSRVLREAKKNADLAPTLDKIIMEVPSE